MKDVVDWIDLGFALVMGSITLGLWALWVFATFWGSWWTLLAFPIPLGFTFMVLATVADMGFSIHPRQTIESWLDRALERDRRVS